MNTKDKIISGSRTGKLTPWIIEEVFRIRKEGYENELNSPITNPPEKG